MSLGSYSTEDQAKNLVSYMQDTILPFPGVASFKYYAWHHQRHLRIRSASCHDQANGQTRRSIRRYGLTKEDIAFIESKIRPMEASDE